MSSNKKVSIQQALMKIAKHKFIIQEDRMVRNI